MERVGRLKTTQNPKTLHYKMASKRGNIDLTQQKAQTTNNGLIKETIFARATDPI
jgi:hypothetical protein